MTEQAQQSEPVKAEVPAQQSAAPAPIHDPEAAARSWAEKCARLEAKQAELAQTVKRQAEEIRRLHAERAVSDAGISDPELQALVAPAVLQGLELGDDLRPKSSDYVAKARALAIKMLPPAPKAEAPAAPAPAPIVTLQPPTQVSRALPRDPRAAMLAILEGK